MATPMLMGAVAYDPKVITIWDGFRAWLRTQGFAFDYVLYSNYERQVEGLFAGHFHVAWNSPLAWVQARRLAARQGLEVAAVAMRDTDRDLTSVVVVARDGPSAPADLRGGTVAVGASDSPQATLLPLEHLRSIDRLAGSTRSARTTRGAGQRSDIRLTKRSTAMLPPDRITPTRRPRTSICPDRIAAIALAPLGSVTSFWRSNRYRIASSIWSSRTPTTPSTSSLTTANVCSPGFGTC